MLSKARVSTCTFRACQAASSETKGRLGEHVADTAVKPARAVAAVLYAVESCQRSIKQEAIDNAGVARFDNKPNGR